MTDELAAFDALRPIQTARFLRNKKLLGSYFFGTSHKDERGRVKNSASHCKGGHTTLVEPMNEPRPGSATAATRRGQEQKVVS